jgi:uncharacterized sulfatase
MTLGVGTLILLSTVALTEYFTITLDPLGAEVFEYGPSEIVKTARTSVDFSASHVAPYALVAFGFSGGALGISYVLPTGTKSHISKVGYGVAVWILLGISVVLWAAPREEDFIGPSYFHIFNNKLVLFAHEIQSDMGNSLLGKYEGPEYPLLHAADTSDVLTAYLNEGSRSPNIVFVIVEGLGKVFVGPDARWGGFAPYLDSLRHESLYWPNTLSTSGSSFNVVPSLFASLPYDDQHYPTKLVEEFGFAIPDHKSLISILEKNGYSTTFYTGSDASFNSINKFLERQGIDKIVDRNDLSDNPKIQSKSSEKLIWGYPDKKIARQVIFRKKSNEKRSPYLDIVRTTSLHTPFDIPEGEKYLREVHRRIDKLNIGPDRKEDYRVYDEVFAELLYADDAVKLLMEAYAKHSGYERTLFVITGDHPTNSVPRNKMPLSPYRVPLLLFSPKLEVSKSFPPVASHLQVTPTLLGHLSSKYDIMQPDSVHWMGGILDTSSNFKAEITVPLMRKKGEFGGYIKGNNMINGKKTYKIRKHSVTNITDSITTKKLQKKVDSYKRMNRHIVRSNNLIDK